jgi:hypothetical protein
MGALVPGEVYTKKRINMKTPKRIPCGYKNKYENEL